MLPLRMLAIGLLMLSRCDADTACSDKLSLDPPEIIAEYGTEVLVNCTSTFLNDGMYWKVGNESFDIKVGEIFTDQAVLLSDWDVTAECKIKLSKSDECSKELEMTIYKNPEVIISINSVHATSKETRYELQCDTINVAPVQNLTVKWYKNDELIQTNIFNDTTKTPVNESSVQSVTVSRGEDVQIRCEAQLNLMPHGRQLPIISQALNVSAHYPPKLNSKEDNYIRAYQDDDITLACEADGNPPPVFRWTYDGMTMAENSSTLVTRVNASATYTCTAGNYLGRTHKQIHVRVMQRPATPGALTTVKAPTPEAKDCRLTVTPSEIVVRFGDPASAHCSTSATNVTVARMGWESPVGGIEIAQRSAVTWMVEKLEDWDAAPLCFVTLNTTDDDDQCNKSLVVTLYKTPDTVSVFAVHPGPMVEGIPFHLQCDISNVAPAQKLRVKWYRDNETVHEQTILNISRTPQNLSFTHMITPEKDYNGSLFRCQAELHLGPNGPDVIPTETSAPYTAIVHYKPFIKACPSSYTQTHKLSMDASPCSAGGNPPPTVQWYHRGKLIDSSEPLTRFGTGKYTAEFENSLGRISTSVAITVEYEPSFNCMDRYEIEMNVGFQTKCEPEGNPAPILEWFKDGRPLKSPLRWTKHDSGNYLLKASNKHGTANHTIYLDVLYGPQFTKGESNKEISPGENVTLECSAEGNPAPSMNWNLSSAANLMETTVGRQKIITITRATSTNAGVYICVATNKVGTVTRSVTLAMKGSSGTPMAVIWVLIFVLIIIAVLVVMFLLHNRLKKHGQYSFAPVNTKDGSNVPMTTMSEGGAA